MKGIFLKKALMLSLAIGLSTPMFAVDGEKPGFFARKADALWSSVQSFRKPAPVAPVVGWGAWMYNGAAKGLSSFGNGIYTAYDYAFNNAATNRVGLNNPTVAQVIKGGAAVAAVAGLGYLAYKKYSKKSEAIAMVPETTEEKPGYFSAAGSAIVSGAKYVGSKIGTGVSYLNPFSYGSNVASDANKTANEEAAKLAADLLKQQERQSAPRKTHQETRYGRTITVDDETGQVVL
jgi:hypothetical protein